jgi:type II secretory pathway component PulK
VMGFDPPVVEALRPYVTAFPLAGGGVNPNTAPPWVLAALDVGDALNEHRGDEDFVRRLLKCRAELPLCESGENCQQVSECLGGPQTPTPAFAFKSDVFRIEARARYGDVRRVVEAVVSRKDPATPEYLAWRVR